MIFKEWAENDTLIGKVCLITGATSGIGKETALALAGMGADLIITGRDEEKTAAVVQEIREFSKNENVNYLIADFSDLDQIRKLVDQFNHKYSKLHVLINNAGVYLPKRIITKYGVEKTFLVNYLAPFLLTNLLLDSLKSSCSSRIINVSSDAHKYGNIDLDDLEISKLYTGMKAYSRSKLANILFTYSLSEMLKEDRICVNALHPGHVATDIWDGGFGILSNMMKKIIGRFSITPKEGADNSIFLAVSPDINQDCGNYYVRRETVRSSDLSYDQHLAKDLWNKSEELVGLS